jgi:hypothetical protein
MVVMNRKLFRKLVKSIERSTVCGDLFVLNVEDFNARIQSINLDVVPNLRVGGFYFPMDDSITVLMESRKSLIPVIECLIHEFSHAKFRKSNDYLQSGDAAMIIYYQLIDEVFASVSGTYLRFAGTDVDPSIFFNQALSSVINSHGLEDCVSFPSELINEVFPADVVIQVMAEAIEWTFELLKELNVI